MTETNLLIGSVSNDLYRVASLIHRGSDKTAARFLQESKRWTKELRHHPLKPYLKKIIQDIDQSHDLSLESGEKYLMYSVLLANYTLHN
jgi:hypothetical protein